MVSIDTTWLCLAYLRHYFRYWFIVLHFNTSTLGTIYYKGTVIIVLTILIRNENILMGTFNTDTFNSNLDIFDIISSNVCLLASNCLYSLMSLSIVVILLTYRDYCYVKLAAICKVCTLSLHVFQGEGARAWLVLLVMYIYIYE